MGSFSGYRSPYPPSKPLQCYNDVLYANIPRGVDARDTRQCIAPTKEKRRCRWTISFDEFDQARALKAAAENTTTKLDRDNVLEEYILLRCCAEQHRWRLEHAPETMNPLIERYSRDILPPLPQGSLPGPPPSPPPGNNAPASVLQGIFDRFVPYERDPLESVTTELLRDIPVDYVSEGQVYFFAHPQDAGYIKIGYTGLSADIRLLDWQNCYPSITLGKQAEFAYPKRIEKLIHLQMAEHRVKIVRCGRCDHTHLEWFHVSAGSATQIIDDWVELNAREALYDPERHLTKAWKKRIDGFKAWKGEDGELTARALLDFLDIEEDLDLIFLRESMDMLALDQPVDNEAESEVTTLPLKGDVPSIVTIATMNLQGDSAEVKTNLNEGVCIVEEREIGVEAC
ncbi:hypothetical protein MMC10_002797 [Thelotrema lepadinum]|nr:hypothetical protein [Thelotrema lepadinum]